MSINDPVVLKKGNTVQSWYYDRAQKTLLRERTVHTVWHFWNGEIFGPPNCSTWTDEGGCRCMLAPEEQ